MTSSRRIAANRENARKSTGPKSESGKQRLSQNARRHGLTTPPDAGAVSSWIEVILDDPALVGRDLERNGMALVASLADAEAQLERVRETEFRFLEDCHARHRSAQHLETVHESVVYTSGLKPGPRIYFNGESCPGPPEVFVKSCKVKEKIERKTYASELRRLFRYRRDAECRRQRALADWISYLRNLLDSKTKPIEEEIAE